MFLLQACKVLEIILWWDILMYIKHFKSLLTLLTIKLAEHLSFYMIYLDFHLKENLIQQTSFLQKVHLLKARIV